MNLYLPQEIIEVISRLQQAGFEAFALGGAVRDLLLAREPKDWDVATNAKPEEVQKIFPDSLYENRFGTVTVKIKNEKQKTKNDNEKLKFEEVQVTTYRVEEKYTDARHPDKVRFVGSLEEDLSRRDFTVNAMAIEIKNEKRKTKNDNEKLKIFDPFNGQLDLQNKLIRAVGNPKERFTEDALRLLRAARFAAELGFKIETQTYEAIKDGPEMLGQISQERIRDEFIKIINSSQAGWGVRALAELGLLKVFLPELTVGIGVAQNKHHRFEVFEHLVRSLDYAVKKNYSLAVRLAALFHDIGKPQSKKGEGKDATFYNHEMIGAKIVEKILRRLKFSNDLREKVVLLVRYHQFYYTPEEVTASSVRRLLKNVGRENIDELLLVREADRIGSGVPKAVPYKLRHLQYMIEQVQTDPVSVKMLAVNGHDLMSGLKIEPGPKLGLILNSLLAEVLEDPIKNQKDILLIRARELAAKESQELKANLDKIEAAQAKQEEEIKKRYYVK